MCSKKNDLPKVFPFVIQEPVRKTEPAAPPPPPKRKSRVSESGLLSAVMSLLSLSALTVAMLGGARLLIDIFAEGLAKGLPHFWAKAVVLGLAYVFGWVTGILSVRVYNNKILPIIIRIYTWGTIAAVCYLYIMIIQRLYRQSYDPTHYWAYLVIVFAGLGALLGLHLIIEGLDLRLYSIPLLIVCLVQVAFIVMRYVFTDNADSRFLLGDLFFLTAMVTSASLMLAHLGVLMPFRRWLTRFFDRNSVVIQPDG